MFYGEVDLKRERTVRTYVNMERSLNLMESSKF